jgi:hypothetical protein
MGGAEPHNTASIGEHPTFPAVRTVHADRQPGFLGLALALLAVCEAIAVAVQFGDVDVVGPIEQRTG